MILCAADGCTTRNNQRRKANRGCGRSPLFCSQCCKNNGGCAVHKVQGFKVSGLVRTGDPSLSASQAASSLSQALTSQATPLRFVGRALKDDYADAAFATQTKREEKAQQVEDERAAIIAKKKTAEIALWINVRPTKFNLLC